jgi:hypothetical protein
MLGSSILEVVIGIIFIFLLYSLLATGIQELLASVFGLRARILRRGIHRMLNDDDNALVHLKGLSTFANKLWAKCKSFLMFFFPYFLQYTSLKPNLATAFYEMPGIKYLGLSNWFKRPSYIRPETFAQNLVLLLKTNGNEPESHTSIEPNLKNGYCHMPNYAVPIQPETKSYLWALWLESNKQEDAFKKLLITWYDATMERVSGLYKRKSQFNTFFIGLAIALIFNVNAIKITNKLFKDDDARAQLTQLAAASIPIAVTSDTTNTSGVDSLAFQAKKVMNMLENDLAKPNNLLALGWDFPPNFTAYIKPIQSPNQQPMLMATEKQAIVGTNPQPSACQRIMQQLYQARLKDGQTDPSIPLTLKEKILYVAFLATEKENLLGLLITAIAISLGAPFWFDLLSKIMKFKNPPQPTPKPE